MPSPLSGFMPQTEQASTSSRIGNALSGFSAGVAGRGQEFNAMQNQRSKELSGERIAAMVKDAESVYGLLNQNDPDRAMELMGDRIKQINKLGGDPSDTLQVYQMLASGDLMGAKSEIETFLKAAKPDQILPSNTLNDQGQYAVRNSITGEVELRSAGGEDLPPRMNPEELKETRQSVRSRVTSINGSLSEIASSYNKVMSLEDGMRSGSRGAVNAAIMNTARLISPGVVTDKDAAALSGANTTVGALREFFNGKGLDADQLLQIYDPTNPDIFDVDALLSVARNVTASAVPSLQAQLNDQRTIANNYNLSSQFKESFFNEGELSGQISDIMASMGGQKRPAGAPSGEVKVPSMEAAQASINSYPVGTVLILPNGDRVIVEDN